MKKKTKTQRLALAATLLTLTGCAAGKPSLASLNPFSKTTSNVPAPAPPSSEGSLTGSVANLAQGTRGQFNSMGSAVKSAYTKTTDSVAGMFQGRAETTDSVGNPIDADDPLRLDNKPKSIGPEVFVANGQLWESTGNFEKAMENYAKALQSEPKNAPALGSIARLHFRQAKLDEAVTFFQRAIEAAPNDAALYNDLGLTLSKMEQHEQAAQAIQQALAIAPGTSRYANNLASVHYAAGRSEQAMKTLREHNKPAVAHFNMAYLDFNAGDYAAARQQLVAALEYEPQASEDSAIQRAVERSREMLAKLDATSDRVAQVAQAAPQAYGAAKQLYETGKEVVRTNSQSYTLSDSESAPATAAAAAAGQTDEGKASAGATPAAAETSEPAKADVPKHPFALPENFFQPTAPASDPVEE